MSRVKPIRTYWIASAALSALMLGAPARAADLKLPVKAPYPQAVFDWTGFYVGGHTGYGRGSNSATLWDPVPTSTSGNFSGVIGGVQGGHNWRHSSGLLLGVEGDLTFPSYLASNSITSLISTPRNDFFEQWDYVGTVRGRIGYATNHWLLYATGGFAFGQSKANLVVTNVIPCCLITAVASANESHVGWTVGGGVEWMFMPRWSAKVEYLYIDTGDTHVNAGNIAIGARAHDNIIRVGANYHF